MQCTSYRSPQSWSEDTIQRFVVIIYRLLLSYHLRSKLQEQKYHSHKFVSSSQSIVWHTFMLKSSSNLLMWRRKVYDVTDVERRRDARGYISALTKYNFSLLGYLYSVNVRGSYRINVYTLVKFLFWIEDQKISNVNINIMNMLFIPFLCLFQKNVAVYFTSNWIIWWTWCTELVKEYWGKWNDTTNIQRYVLRFSSMCYFELYKWTVSMKRYTSYIG
jgi:hypothetical protein